MTDELVGIGEIAKYLKVSKVTVWRYVRFGGMPVIKMYTGSVRAVPDEIDRWKIETDAEMKSNERS